MSVVVHSVQVAVEVRTERKTTLEYEVHSLPFTILLSGAPRKS